MKAWKKYGKIPVYILSVVGLFGLWWIVSFLLKQPLVLPSPFQVFKSLANLLFNPSFMKAVFKTGSRCLESFALSCILGFFFGLLCAKSAFFKLFFAPWFALVKATPVVSIILLCLFALDSSRVPVFVAFLMTFPLVVNAVNRGFSEETSAEKDFVSLYGLGSFRNFVFVKMNRAFPVVSTGIKSAGALVWKVVAAGEVLCIPRISIGNYLQHAQVSLETQEVFAITLIIVTLSVIFELLVMVILKLLGFIYGRFCHMLLLQSLGGDCKALQKKINLDSCNAYEIRGFCLEYQEPLYEDFGLSFEKNAVTVLMGASGLGKTSLLRFMADLPPQKNGRGSFCEASRAVLLQEPYLIPSFTVLENLLIPVRKKGCTMEQVKEILELLEIQDLMEKKTTLLSGGEKQRVALAQTMLYGWKKELLLLDEPFNSLDQNLRNRILPLLADFWRSHGQTVLVVLHQKEDALLLGARIVRLEGRPVRNCSSENLL